MALSAEGKLLRDQFLKVLVDTAIELQRGDDPEVTLEALIEASKLLTEHLEGELQELRQEQAE
jgi:ribosomal protein S15P/S13E